MNRITLTYVLQAATAGVMLSTMLVGYLASTQKQFGVVAFNCVLFWVCFGLSYWQSRIRQTLKTLKTIKTINH